MRKEEGRLALNRRKFPPFTVDVLDCKKDWNHIYHILIIKIKIVLTVKLLRK